MGSFLLFACQKGKKITCAQYRYIQYYVERVEKLCYVVEKFRMVSENVLISTVPCSLPRREQQSGATIRTAIQLFYLILLLEVLRGTAGD